jgi:hypothetical protein
MSKYKPGVHYGRIVDFTITKSKNKGTPAVKFVLKVLGQVNPQDPSGMLLEAPEGRAWVSVWLTEGAIHRGSTKKNLSLLCGEAGIRGDFDSFKDWNDSSGRYAKVVGVEVKIDNNPNGEYDNWEFAMGGFKKADDNVIAQLDSLYGAAMRGSQSTPYSEPESPPQTESPRAPDPTDEFYDDPPSKEQTANVGDEEDYDIPF